MGPGHGLSCLFCLSSRSYFSVSSLTMVSQSSLALLPSWSESMLSTSRGLILMEREIFFSSSNCSLVLVISSLRLEHLRRRMLWLLLPFLQLVAFLFVLASFLVSSFLLLRDVSFSLQPPWPSFQPLPCEAFPPLPSFVDSISFLARP